MLELLRTNRDLRWVFMAQVVSFMGDWFVFVALAGFVHDATDSAILVSLVLVAFSLPSFLMSPLAGPVVDKWDRKRLLVVVSVAQAGAASGLLLMRDDRVWVAFVFQGLVAGLAAFVKPAIDAGVPSLTRSPDELRRANALLGSTWGVMLALGAGLGGLFSQTFGRRAAIVADVASFVVAAGIFALIRRPMQGERQGPRVRVRPVADMREALRVARHDPVILALMSSKASFAIGAGIVSQLAVLADDVFRAGDRGTGLLLAARGVGSGIGPILATRWVRGSIRRALTLCGWASIAFAASYLATAWVPVFAAASVLVCVAHLGGGAQWTTSTYGLQMRVDPAVLGRVMAGDFAIVTLVLSLTSVGAGVVSAWLGVRWAITVFALVAAAAGTTYLVLTRHLRATATS